MTPPDEHRHAYAPRKPASLSRRQFSSDAFRFNFDSHFCPNARLSLYARLAGRWRGLYSSAVPEEHMELCREAIHLTGDVVLGVHSNVSGDGFNYTGGRGRMGLRYDGILKRENPGCRADLGLRLLI
jgi:hypothetical protein